jgi:hypothetical protein
MIVLLARCTVSTNVVSPGAAWAVSGARPAKKWPPRCRPQDPEQAGVIDDLRDHLPAAVALHRYHERDVVSHRYAAERAAIGMASRPAKVLVRLILRLVGLGPRLASSLIG